MRLDVGLPTEIVTAGSDSNVSVCIRLGVEAIQRNCYNETNNKKRRILRGGEDGDMVFSCGGDPESGHDE